MKKLNVAIIGAKFMGKAHSSLWSRVLASSIHRLSPY